jgi:uncharacterized MAPEG superfamily protein
MSIALWCVLVAAVMPALTVAIAKRNGTGYDNRDPRGWAANLDGFRKRAHAAHHNAYEFFPFFAVAVIVAEWKGGGGTFINLLALAILAARFGYTGFYLKDMHVPRSAAWLFAWGGTILMFCLGAFGK